VATFTGIRIQRVLPYFRDINSRTDGVLGFVSIQGNPFRDDDPENIVAETHRYLELGSNVIAKIPVTRAGLIAIEQLVAEDVPIIATEVMSLSQALYAADMYRRITSASGKRPPFFLTHITGIFDQYVTEDAARTGVDIHPDILFQAGTILARRQYHELKSRGYRDIIMLGGGARGVHHFTELVGSDVHITINWEPTAKALLDADSPVVFRMETTPPEFMVNELLKKIPAFRTAYAAEELSVDEFESFGPVQLFRSMFCDGWTRLVEAVRSRRVDREE
jgi:transaldolase